MQRIFKKSCKQDMIDLFNILPDFVEIIEYEDKGIIAKGKTAGHYTSYFLLDCVLNINFETDNIKEMIIQRPIEVVNDLD